MWIIHKRAYDLLLFYWSECFDLGLSARLFADLVVEVYYPPFLFPSLPQFEYALGCIYLYGGPTPFYIDSATSV